MRARLGARDVWPEKSPYRDCEGDKRPGQVDSSFAGLLCITAHFGALSIFKREGDGVSSYLESRTRVAQFAVKRRGIRAMNFNWIQV